MAGCRQDTGHGIGRIPKTATSTTQTQTKGTTLKERHSEEKESFLIVDSSEESNRHHEYGHHHPGFQTRHQSHVGSVQGPTDRFQHRQSSQGARPSIHHRHHSGGFSDRSAIGIHRFESERIRTGIETEESRRYKTHRGCNLQHLPGQQFCPLALQTDQRTIQQHADQPPDGHVRLQGDDRHGIEL